MLVGVLFVLSALLTLYGHASVAGALLLAAVLPGQPLQRRLLAVAAVLVALTLAQRWLHQQLEARVPERASAVFETVRGHVAQVPERVDSFPGKPPGWHFELQLDTGLRQAATARRLLVRWYPDEPRRLCLGQRLEVRLRARPPRALVNPHAADGERQLLARGIHGVARADSVRPLSGCHHLRERVSTRLRQQLAAYPLAAAIMPALVVGDRRHLDDAHWRRLQRTGTVHLVAISGLHISLLALFSWWLARAMISLVQAHAGGTRHSGVLALVPAAMMALGYAWLAGFSAPTLRALVMAMLAFAVRAAGVQLSLMRVLVTALAIMIALQPGLALLAGFWLSVTAVALLALLAGLPRPLLLGHALMTLPLGLLAGHWFGFWSLSALLANLVLVPVFAFCIVPGALLASATGSSALLLALAEMLEWLWVLLGWLEVLPGLPLPATDLVLGGVFLALCALVHPGLPGCRGPLVLLLLLVLPPLQWRPPPGTFEVLAFDAGQGQALAVRTHDFLLLYDTGPSVSLARRQLVPWLQRQPQRQRMLVISHGDGDHAGGLAAIRDASHFHWHLAGEPERQPGFSACQRGQAWQRDGVSVQVLWPAAEIATTVSNNRSCVLLVRGRQRSLLLTGDIEKPVEYWLLANGLGPVDLVTMPHHGSGSSSSFALVRRLQARHVLVSAGWQNRYGHPLDRVVQRWHQQHAQVLNTADHGALLFPAHKTHSASALSWRWQQRRPWRQGLPVVE